MTITTMKRITCIIFSSILLFEVAAILLTPATVLGQTSRQPSIVNVTLTNGDSEYSYVVPHDTTRISVTARGGAIKFSWLSGSSGTTYQTIQNGTTWCAKDVSLSPGNVSNILYMQSATGGMVAEIQTWR